MYCCKLNNINKYVKNYFRMINSKVIVSEHFDDIENEWENV